MTEEKDKRLKSWKKGLSANPLEKNYDQRLVKGARAIKKAMNRPEIKRKISKTSKGKYFSFEARKKMSESHKGKRAWNKGLTKETDKRVAKMSEKIKIKNSTLEAREANRERMILQHANPNSIWNSPEYKENKRKSSKKMWENPNFIKKWIIGQAKGQHISPNNLEQYFDKITPEYVNFIGNRKNLIIITKKGVRYPDFQIIKTRKIIELFGDYWHKEENPEDLIKEYKEVNWECIVFWESEVYNETDRVLRETLEFISKISKN